MRKIATLDNPAAAHRFAAYLAGRGIAAMVDEEDESAEIWVRSEESLDDARTAFAHFQEHPEDQRYQKAQRRVAAESRTAARQERQRRSRTVDVRTANPTIYAPLVTIVLVMICILVVATGGFMGTEESPRIDQLQLSPVAFEEWELWRLVTPIFVHGGPIHLIFNLLWVFQLGVLIESRRGNTFMVLLVLVAAVLSNVAQFLISGGNFGGMSGVLYALAGYVWLVGRLRPSLGIAMDNATAFLLGMWLLLCFTGAVGPIANAAHVGGLAVGLSIAWLEKLVRR